ncbi:hypothetical protein HKX48_006366 [Thoreauomyces humboldtii]|nr:hypothetical protein HKX48_006366 [Thoreauomyces humboldtii]
MSTLVERAGAQQQQRAYSSQQQQQPSPIRIGTSDGQALSPANNDSDSDEDDYESPTDDITEPIDFGLVYALHTFVANLEGQVCVLKGDELDLLDDSNSYWWLVKCLKTDEIGYIPAENVETPFERLARLNKSRNVTITTPGDTDMLDPPPIPPEKRRNIFFPDNFVEYIMHSDDEEDDDEDGDGYGPGADTLARQQKPNTNSLSRNFLSKLLTRGNTKKKQDPGSSLSLDRSPRMTPSASLNDISKEPISVLRIYAGNVDLKATFKTVALTPSLTATDLLEVALRRFRVPNATPNEFYVSVLHMDAQERRLGEHDKISDVLETLRHKSLPGVGDSASVSVVVSNSGGSSSVRITDENIIKVLINKKLNLFEKNYHLIRIFMVDEHGTGNSPTRQQREQQAEPLRTYKTIGVNSNTTVAEIKETAYKKFKIARRSGYAFTLNSIFKGREQPRDDGERIYPILMMAEGTAEEIDFVLRKEWVGHGPAPTANDSPYDGTQRSSLMEDLQSILELKPAFLEELPTSASSTDIYNANPNLGYTDQMSDGSGSGGPSRSQSSEGFLEPSVRQPFNAPKASPDRQLIPNGNDGSQMGTIGRMLSDAALPPGAVTATSQAPVSGQSIYHQQVQQQQTQQQQQPQQSPPQQHQRLAPGPPPTVASRGSSLRYEPPVNPLTARAGSSASTQQPTTTLMQKDHRLSAMSHQPQSEQQRTSPPRSNGNGYSEANGREKEPMIVPPPRSAASEGWRLGGKQAMPTPSSIPVYEAPGSEVNKAMSPNRSNNATNNNSAVVRPTLPGADGTYRPTSSPALSTPSSPNLRRAVTTGSGGDLAGSPGSRRANVRSSRVNFETMEEYLEEILKGQADVQKLRTLEAKMRDAMTVPGGPTSKSAVPLPTLTQRSMSGPLPLAARYDDSGLDEILRPRTQNSSSNVNSNHASTTHLGYGTSNGSLNNGPMSPPLLSPTLLRAKTESRKQSTASIALNSIYDTLQTDLDASIHQAAAVVPIASTSSSRSNSRRPSAAESLLDTHFSTHTYQSDDTVDQSPMPRYQYEPPQQGLSVYQMQHQQQQQQHQQQQQQRSSAHSSPRTSQYTTPAANSPAPSSPRRTYGVHSAETGGGRGGAVDITPPRSPAGTDGGGSGAWSPRSRQGSLKDLSGGGGVGGGSGGGSPQSASPRRVEAVFSDLQRDLDNLAKSPPPR